MLTSGLAVMGTIGVCGLVSYISERMNIKQETKDCVEIITSSLAKTMCGGTLIYCAIQVVKAFIALG